MSFVHGWFLWLLFPVVIYLFRRREKQGFRQNLRWGVLILLIIAIARPVLPQSATQESVKSHFVVIALDLSLSMNANDIQPTRAEASRQSIKAFLEEEGHEQIALLGFTINPLLLCPPTTDHALVQVALENINPAYILTKGTDLRKLFEKVAQFKEHEKRVILFSDGGDEVLEEELISFVEEAKIKILAIGMATPQGASVTKKDGTLLQNGEGHIVVSKLNLSLQTLAEQSGGDFVRFRTVEDTVKSIASWLKHEANMKELEKEGRNYFELGVIPLFLALVLFFLSATRFSKKLLALLLMMGFNLQAEELISRERWGEGVEKVQVEKSTLGFFDGYYLQKAYGAYAQKEYGESQKYVYKMKTRTLEAELLLAYIFYRQEKYKAAKSLLKGIKSREKQVKQQIYYALGNCEAKMRYLERAKNYYVKALQLGEDEDSLHNLEVVVFRQKEDSFKVGYTNPASAEASKTKQEDLEKHEEERSSQKNESTGGSGETGSKRSKNSTVKVMDLEEEEGQSKRVLSSKAYDLINEGYIREERPW